MHFATSAKAGFLIGWAGGRGMPLRPEHDIPQPVRNHATKGT